MGHIRAKAIGVILNDERLLVTRGFDPGSNQVFYVTPGGKIEFGESGAACVIREFWEEVGAEICDVERIGVVEHIFEFDSEPRHEIVLIYSARFADPSYYSKSSLPIDENGRHVTGTWMHLSEFSSGNAILGPSGLIDIIIAAQGRDTSPT